MRGRLGTTCARWARGSWGVLPMCALLGCSGCSSGTSAGTTRVVAAASPPKDDGSPSEGGNGGGEHSAALEELKIGAVVRKLDKQGAVAIPLPDADHWVRVKFWGVPSLVGFRYGKEHHALVGGFVTHVADNSVQGACMKSFEEWANPWIDAFDVEVKHEAPMAVMWHRQIVEVDSVFAKTATMASHDSYAGTYAAFPVWKNACLIVGIAIPGRDDDDRAREVRDRFAREVLPKIEVLAAEEPPERY
jgi:hypothetical protein